MYKVTHSGAGDGLLHFCLEPALAAGYGVVQVQSGRARLSQRLYDAAVVFPRLHRSDRQEVAQSRQTVFRARRFQFATDR